MRINLQTIFVYSLILGLISCQSSGITTGQNTKKENQTIDLEKETVSTSSRSSEATKAAIDTSMYTNPRFAQQTDRQREQLHKLAHAGIFDPIHLNMSDGLAASQAEYFQHHRNLLILAQAKGDIFGNGLSDRAYILYDKDRQQVDILFYDQKNASFKFLYRDINVSNTLRQSDCFYASTTLDYVIADELIYQEDYMHLNKSNYLIDDHGFSIDNIAVDKQFDLKRGCLNKDFSRQDMSNTVCIPTSSVYANYQCLKYNRTKQIFEIYFSQEFAD